MNLTTRHSSAALIALLLCVFTDTARAWVIPVEDATRWLEMYYMLRYRVIPLTQQIQRTLEHVKNAAQGLGDGNLVEDILLAHRRLTSDLRSISYSVDTVTAQFRAVFPDDQAAAHVDPADVPALRSGWDNEIHQSSLAAARAQSALSTVERNTASAQSILERSKATAGAAGDEGSRLAKLQALVQMLGVINSDLTTLATTIATTERVNASIAAAGASDEELEAAQAERMLRDYDKSEPIPDVDPGLFHW
jgi:conjugal transfer/entry exclusion protein